MNQSTSTYAPLSEESPFGDSAAFRLAGLRTIATALVNARMDAELIEESVVAYFIDMAITEVQRQSRLQQEIFCRRRDDETKRVVRLID